jgi:hypothetical protein
LETRHVLRLLYCEVRSSSPRGGIRIYKGPESWQGVLVLRNRFFNRYRIARFDYFSQVSATISCLQDEIHTPPTNSPRHFNAFRRRHRVAPPNTSPTLPTLPSTKIYHHHLTFDPPRHATTLTPHLLARYRALAPSVASSLSRLPPQAIWKPQRRDVRREPSVGELDTLPLCIRQYTLRWHGLA